MSNILSENKVCPSCLETNLLTEIKVARCAKCGLAYCTHLASNIDPSYCTSCLSDVTVLMETVTKTYEHYNEETDVVTTYKRRAKSVRLEGMDWLFAQRKISTMSDESLTLAIEYHRALLTGLLDEREARRVKYAHRYAGEPLPKSVPHNEDGSVITTTKVKTTKAIKSTKQSATAAGVVQSLMAKNMTPQQMIDLLKKMQAAIK